MQRGEVNASMCAALLLRGRDALQWGCCLTGRVPHRGRRRAPAGAGALLHTCSRSERLRPRCMRQLCDLRVCAACGCRAWAAACTGCLYPARVQPRGGYGLNGLCAADGRLPAALCGRRFCWCRYPSSDVVLRVRDLATPPGHYHPRSRSALAHSAGALSCV